MALTKAEDLKISSELYEAVTYGNDARVIELCASIPLGPLHITSIHDDTVLSLAINYKKNDLVLDLLNMVPMCDSRKLTCQNIGGNTILHETALNNSTIGVANELLRRAPMLLHMTNKLGETALFSAALHGKTKIFKFLHNQVCRQNHGNDLKPFLQRDDKSTILHAAILGRNYCLAHEIAVKYEHLVHEIDGDEMTPLQLLSCIPLTFEHGGFFKRMIYTVIGQDFEDTSKMLPWLRKMKKEKHNYEWAIKLIKLLVKADTSWQRSASWVQRARSAVHSYGRNKASIVEHEQMVVGDRKPDTPLLLATVNGCKEIVAEILKVYPQAVEHINRDGRSLVSLAILHRRIEILDLVDSMKLQKHRVKRIIDNYGNTLLHLVGQKVDCPPDDLKGPGLILQVETLLFKRVKDSCVTVDAMRLNSQGKTAEQVFFENNDKLRSDAKEWMCENAKNCSIVGVLFATVAFAAAYTVPGGSDQQTGHPILKDKPLFLIFTISDAISLSSSLTSVIIFLNIVTSSYHFKDFEKSLFQKLYIGLTLLIVSVSMMMVAFGATLVLTISSGRTWTDVILYAVSFFPVLVFVFTYVQFYKQLIGAIYQGFKQMIRATLWHHNNPKPHYDHRFRHQQVDSRLLV